MSSLLMKAKVRKHIRESKIDGPFKNTINFTQEQKLVLEEIRNNKLDTSHLQDQMRWMEFHRYEEWTNVGKKIKQLSYNWNTIDPAHEVVEFFADMATSTYRRSLEPHLTEIREMGKPLGRTRIFRSGTKDLVGHLKYIFRNSYLMIRGQIAAHLLNQIKKANTSWTT